MGVEDVMEFCDRFVKVQHNEHLIDHTNLIIIKDKITGVLYLYTYKGQTGASITPLLGSDGKPMIEPV